MSVQTRPAISDLLLRRVCSEFLEMPGLRLTCAQAQRLWALDEATCRQVLTFLVNAGFLARGTGDTYHRATDGHTVFSHGHVCAGSGR